MSQRKPVMVNCPRCGRKALFAPENAWRPFCSQACKTNDLGAWASDQYVIGGNSLESAGDQEAQLPGEQ